MGPGDSVIWNLRSSFAAPGRTQIQTVVAGMYPSGASEI